MLDLQPVSGILSDGPKPTSPNYWARLGTTTGYWAQLMQLMLETDTTAFRPKTGRQKFQTPNSWTVELCVSVLSYRGGWELQTPPSAAGVERPTDGDDITLVMQDPMVVTCSFQDQLVVPTNQ